MRSKKEMLSLIINTAENDERIRAVILSGSRTNVKIKPDVYQDYDVVYVVKELSSFLADPAWIDVFGERIIMQTPDSMQIEETDEARENQFAYLMLFTDTNRIDLTLVELGNQHLIEDSLNKVLLDKDHLFPKSSEPSDRDYWIKRLTQQQFSDCCNEFWWVSTYVMKGLLRQELPYAKAMLENPVRKMFMKMLAWQVGVNTNFSVNLGMSYKFMEQYVSTEVWESIIRTYPDADYRNIWHSLNEMTSLFDEVARKVASDLDLVYHEEEATKVIAYLRSMAKRLS